MQIFVTVRARAKQGKIEQLTDDHYRVSVREPPIENKANFAVFEVLAAHFKVPLARVKLVRGRTERNKVFEIL